MKRIIYPLLPFALLISLVACPADQKKDSRKIVVDGEMVELYTPADGDTFSWVLVTGRAATRQGFVQLDLQGNDASVIARRGVTLTSKLPDTAEIKMVIAVPGDKAPQGARIRAYTMAIEKSGKTDAATIPVYAIPGSEDAHATILRFYAALDTNNFEAAYKLLSPQGQGYPNLYGGEAVFAARPKMAEIKTWKQATEKIRVMRLRPETMLDLPTDNLFCYRAWIERVVGEQKTVEPTYVFLKRQPDGSFLLYKPRRDPYKAD